MTGAIEFLRKLKVLCDNEQRCTECPLEKLCIINGADIKNEADLVRKVMNYETKEANHE